MSSPKFLTVVQYAEIVRREASVIRRRILTGKLKAIKLGKTWIIDVKELPKQE
jgi:hypothetical protein